MMIKNGTNNDLPMDSSAGLPSGRMCSASSQVAREQLTKTRNSSGIELLQETNSLNYSLELSSQYR